MLPARPIMPANSSRSRNKIWVYDRSRSLLLAIIMHTGLKMSTIVFGLQSAKGMTIHLFDLSVSSALWTVIALVCFASQAAARHGMPEVNER